MARRMGKASRATVSSSHGNQRNTRGRKQTNQSAKSSPPPTSSPSLPAKRKGKGKGKQCRIISESSEQESEAERQNLEENDSGGELDRHNNLQFNYFFSFSFLNLLSIEEPENRRGSRSRARGNVDGNDSGGESDRRNNGKAFRIKLFFILISFSIFLL